MSTPACIANAIADALGIADVPLPATPDRLHALMAGAEEAAPEGTAPPPARPTGGHDLSGTGSVVLAAPPERVWAALLDPEILRAVIPGCRSLDLVGENSYRAVVSLGVGPVRGEFRAEVALSDLVPPREGRLSGSLSGQLGAASGSGLLKFSAEGAATRIDYEFGVAISGKAASIGGRLMQGATDLVVRQFFERFGRQLGAPVVPQAGDGGIWAWLLRLFGVRR